MNNCDSCIEYICGDDRGPLSLYECQGDVASFSAAKEQRYRNIGEPIIIKGC